MSGASNFDMVDNITRKTNMKDDGNSKYRNTKLTSLQNKKMENDLEFLHEDNQWAAIYKYNKFLYDKEADIIKQRFIYINIYNMQRSREKNQDTRGARLLGLGETQEEG